MQALTEAWRLMPVVGESDRLFSIMMGWSLALSLSLSASDAGTVTTAGVTEARAIMMPPRIMANTDDELDVPGPGSPGINGIRLSRANYWFPVTLESRLGNTRV